ncbi:hypothetical protein BN2476_1140009 [Paraburkholderia piptadeniae]|uniref:Uncharacterized protein n=2 Tax=Paraburkholderia piptadeniae TaxID=1701573 RepID=A0A1N7SV71_9BURK|nr:hypothetical protein BN2476_1140009 [Paraburkholderia piptadeniae]
MDASEALGWIMVLVFVAAYAGIGMGGAACRLHSIAGPPRRAAVHDRDAVVMSLTREFIACVVGAVRLRQSLRNDAD